MKATLEFTLPEEQQAFEIACRADQFQNAMGEIRQHVRDKLKHGKLSAATRRELEAVKALLPIELL